MRAYDRFFRLSLFVGSQKFDIGKYISTYKLGDFVMMTIH